MFLLTFNKQKIIWSPNYFCKTSTSLILTKSGPAKKAIGEVTILMPTTIIPDLTVINKAKVQNFKNFVKLKVLPSEN